MPCNRKHEQTENQVLKGFPMVAKGAESAAITHIWATLCTETVLKADNA